MWGAGKITFMGVRIEIEVALPKFPTVRLVHWLLRCVSIRFLHTLFVYERTQAPTTQEISRSEKQSLNEKICDNNLTNIINGKVYE